MILKLERFAYLPKGTLGQLYLPDGRVLYTVEREWDGNKPNVSCVPEGVYLVEKFNGAKFKNVFQIMDVPGRTFILFHAANYPSELEGCIAPGLSMVDYYSVQPGVQSSRDAMDVLREVLPESGCELHITHFVPEYP